jgi:hypothetical protein
MVIVQVEIAADCLIARGFLTLMASSFERL